MVGVHARNPPVMLVRTCQSNHWDSEDFCRLVDHNEQHEVRVTAAYGRQVDIAAIRYQVIGAILTYAIPAGNA